MTAPDHGLTTGMSVCFLRDDLETATRTIADLGFEAMEVYGGHLGPGMPGVAAYEGHAAAAGELIRRHGSRANESPRSASASVNWPAP